MGNKYEENKPYINEKLEYTKQKLKDMNESETMQKTKEVFKNTASWLGNKVGSYINNNKWMIY